MNPPTEDAANPLDEYFTEKLNVVNRDTWGDVKQSQILAALDSVLSIVRPTSHALLISRYERSRRQVWQKVRPFRSKDAPFEGGMQDVPSTTIRSLAKMRKGG